MFIRLLILITKTNIKTMKKYILLLSALLFSLNILSTPVITNVLIETGSYKIGEQIVITIFTDGDDYTLVSGTINTGNITNFEPIASTNNYRAIYTVQETQPDISISDDIAVNITLSDGATSTYDTDFPSGSVTIDATRPVLSLLEVSHTTITDENVEETFTVTIEFNEAMRENDFILTFEPSVGSLEFQSINWSDTKNCEVNYEIKNIQNQESGVDIKVTAKDEAGNSSTKTETNLFSMEIEQPFVSRSVELINEALDGSNFIVTVTYNEAMKADSYPTIEFLDNSESSIDISSSLTNKTPLWETTKICSFTYTIADDNITEKDIMIKISGAKNADDGDGDNQILENAFSIDTKKPVITNISVENDPVYEQNKTQKITIVYDEAMDKTPSAAPIIDLSDNTNWSAQYDGDWTNSKTYVCYIDHNGTPEQNINYTITVLDASGAKDVAGNVEENPNNIEISFIVDTKKPTIVENGLVVSPQATPLYDNVKTFTVDITFSEPINISTFTNTISFANISNEPAISLVSWSVGNTKWSATYTIADDNEITTASISCNNYYDIAGNVQTTTTTNNFDIDTQNPTIVSITPSTTVFNNTITDNKLLITVVYNKTMDINTAPAILLSGTHWGTQTGVGWSQTNITNDSYTAYFIHDGFEEGYFEECASISIESGATDIAGNADATATNTCFDLDTQKPTYNVGINGGNTMVTDSDVASPGTFYIDIIFSEPMDESTGDISIDFNTALENPIGNGFTFNNKDWINSTTYRFTYNLTDMGEDIRDIDFIISGDVKDLYGNGFEEQIFTDQFSIDMENPSTQVEYSHDMITDDDIPGNFIITYTFSEPMSSTPILNPVFPVENPTNTITSPTSGWLDEFKCQFTYTIADNNEQISNVDIVIDGFKDVNGNEMSLFEDENALDINTGNPTASVEIVPELVSLVNLNGAENGYEFTLIANYTGNLGACNPDISFDNPDIAEVAGGEWNGNQWTQLFSYNNLTPIELNDICVNIEGVCDAYGNMQPTQTCVTTFSLDIKPPNGTLSIITPDNNVITDNNLTITIQILYDDEMLVLPKPEISINNDWQTIPPTGTWLNASLYEVSYNFVDAGEELSNISLCQYGAKDNATNEEINCEPIYFNIDTKNPSVFSIDYLDSEISFNETQIIYITYDEDMSNLLNPNVFIKDIAQQNYTGSFEWGGGEWADSRTYSITATLINTALPTTQLFVQTADATDVVGNIENINSTINTSFYANGKKPIIVEIIKNPTPILYDDIGPNNYLLTLIFDEPMNTTFGEEPDIEIVGATDYLSESTKEWSTADNKKLRITYNVLSSDIDNSFDLMVSGAKNAFNNQMETNTYVATIDIDTDVPEVSFTPSSSSVAITETIVVIFDQSVFNLDASEIVNNDWQNNNIFTLKYDNDAGEDVQYTVINFEDNKILTVKPINQETDMDYCEDYYVAIAPKIMDMSGNKTEREHYFKTESQPAINVSDTAICWTGDAINNPTFSVMGTVLGESNTEWFFGQTSLSNEIIYKPIFTQAIDYFLTVTNNYHECTVANNFTFTINSLPNPMPEIDGPTAPCENGALLYADVNNNQYFDYDWKLDNNSIDSHNSTHTALVAGEYKVEVFNKEGCSITSAEHIIENVFIDKPLIKTMAEINGLDEKVCSNDYLYCVPNKTNTIYKKIIWTIDGIEKAASTDEMQVTNQDKTILITITDDYNCVFDTEPRNISDLFYYTVTPKVDFKNGSETLLLVYIESLEDNGSLLLANQYEWYIDFKKVPEATHHWYSLTELEQNKDYRIYAKIKFEEGECEVTSDTAIFTGVGANTKNIKLFPNPATTIVNYNFNNEQTGNVDIQLYNSTGQLISTESLYKKHEVLEGSLELNNYVAGIYIIKFIINEKEYYEKIWIK